MLTLRMAGVTEAELICQIIKDSFAKQAAVLGITQEKHPNFVAYETVKRVQNRMSSGDTVIILYRNNEPVGTISYSADNRVRKGYIKRLAVIPPFRSNGYGEILMNYAEDRLEECNVSRIELAIVAQFQGLERYYQRMGYVSREKKIFSSLPFEVLFMGKQV